MSSVLAARSDRWRRPAIVIASLGLHAVVLGYMAFQEFETRRRYAPERARVFEQPIYVRIEPRTAVADASEKRRTQTRRRLPISRRLESGRPIPAEDDTTPSNSSVEPVADQDSAWAVTVPRPQPGVQSATPRDALGDRIARSLRSVGAGCTSPDRSEAERSACEERLAQRAAAAPNLGPPPDADRDEGFARQVRANEAWRSYTRGEGAYPGLRSLFSER